MKKMQLSLSLLLAVAIAISTIATTSAMPSGQWRSGIACQNLDPINDAQVRLTFFANNSSTEAIHYDAVILAGKSSNWVTNSSTSMPGFPSNFSGSAVVSSSTALACNVNTEIQGATGTTTSPYRSGTSGGFTDTQTGPTLYVPQVMGSYFGYNSYVSVQNTSDTSPVTVDVFYYNSTTGAEVTLAKETKTIPANSSVIFDQSANANLTSFLGSAKIVAQGGTIPLAATVQIYNDLSAYTKAQLQSYNAAAVGSTKLFVPRFVRTFYGYNSGTSIQNISGGDVTITINFKFGTNTYTYTSGIVKNGASLALFAPNITQIAGVDALPINDHAGSAIITATGNIVAIINEDNRTFDWRTGQGSTYNAIPDGSQTTKVFFAQVPRNVAGIFSGGFQVSNTTDTAATCDITYSGATTANETNVSLPANGSFLRYAPNVANLPNGFNSSVLVDCKTVGIVGISNFQALNKYGDSFVQTNGLNQ